ncbi:hypothetical protein ABEM58_21695, partial [Escherichia coli]
WKGWAISHRQKQKKLIMLPSETMIWQPEFTDKTLSRKPGAVHTGGSGFPPVPPFPGFYSETPGTGKTCFFPSPGLDN